MRIAIVASVFFSVAAIALGQTTLYVPDDHATIQAAIGAAANGDTIVVRPGTYVENIDFAGKAVTVIGEKGPERTIVDGNKTDRCFIFQSGEGRNSVLEGFTITNGDAQGGNGGGIDCTLESGPTITNCIIAGNRAAALGGGIACRGFSHAKITGCTFINNVSEGAYEGSQGGGLSCFILSNAIVTDCVFINNESQWGGGLDCSGSYPVITNCVFRGNEAYIGGGAIFCSAADPTITNCTIVDNNAAIGGGLVTAGAVLPSYPALANSILWNNSPEEIYIGIGDVTVDFCDVQGGWPGTGNIDETPSFVDLDSGDFHLNWYSPCRDAGYNGAVSATADYEGDRRIALGRVDMGADEYYYHLYHKGDVIPGASISLRVIGYPDAPVLLALGSGLLSTPISTEHGDLWLAWPPLWQGTVGIVAPNGLLSFPATVPAGWTPGAEFTLQALVGPWGGPLAQLTNAETLVVE